MAPIPLPPTSHQPQPYTGPSAADVLALRREFLNPGLFLYYQQPLMLVEGKMQYVWDERGLLLGKGGMWGQTIRLAPPMCLTKADADFILAVLDEAIGAG